MSNQNQTKNPTSNSNAQEGNMNTSTVPQLPESVATKDGETVPAAQAVALNFRRIGFAKIVLLSQLGLPDDSGLPMIQQEVAKTSGRLTAASDPKTGSELNLRLAKLKLVEAAMKINAVLREKGPTAFCFATATTAKAAQIAGVFGRPDLSQPVKGMAKDQKAPELFVSLTEAYEGWKKTAEADAERRADREKAEAEKAAKAKLEAEKAIAERNRQATETLSIADAILADTVEASPEVVQRVDSDAAKQLADEEARKQASQERIAAAEKFFRAVFLGELRAAMYFNKYVKRGSVSDEETGILSLKSLAAFAAAPADTEIESRVTGTVMKGRLGDTRSRVDRRARWMVMTVPVTLTTRDGKVAKDHDTREVLTSSGFMILEWREAETAKRVAFEMSRSGALKLADRDGNPISLVGENGELAWDKFCSVYYLKTLQKAAEWAAGEMQKRLDRKNARQNGDDEPGKVVATGDFEPPTVPDAAPKADAERDTSSDPKVPKTLGTSKGRKSKSGRQDADSDGLALAPTPRVKGTPGDHVDETPRTAYSDPDGEVKTSMLDVLRRTVAKADENPTK